jgi:hypothetical protein
MKDGLLLLRCDGGALPCLAFAVRVREARKGMQAIITDKKNRAKRAPTKKTKNKRKKERKKENQLLAGLIAWLAG